MTFSAFEALNCILLVSVTFLGLDFFGAIYFSLSLILSFSLCSLSLFVLSLFVLSPSPSACLHLTLLTVTQPTYTHTHKLDSSLCPSFFLLSLSFVLSVCLLLTLLKQPHTHT